MFLKIEEVEKPAPKDQQVLIKVHAASINAMDWRGLRAKPIIIRMMGGGFLKPKNPRMGSDVAGRVEAVGENVTQFQPGDDGIRVCERRLCRVCSCQRSLCGAKTSQCILRNCSGCTCGGAYCSAGFSLRRRDPAGAKSVDPGCIGRCRDVCGTAREGVWG
jgi:NADPH:quinone reductase-like Zn-dependent oxidoreductase